jgi:hypothetical protein
MRRAKYVDRRLHLNPHRARQRGSCGFRWRGVPGRPVGAQSHRMDTPGTGAHPATGRIRRISWLGGSPCSGKSAVLAILAGLGAATYSCDDRFAEHAVVAVLDGRPTFAKVMSLSACTRLAQPVEVQVRDVLALADEQWPYIVTDLEAQLAPRVVAEGSALRPKNLVALGVEPSDAVWLVPTPSFQRQQYATRDWAMQLVASCADPAASFERWMSRDEAFANTIVDEALREGIHVVEVDGSNSPETLAEAIGRHFDL